MSTVKSNQSTGLLFVRALIPIVILAGGIGAFLAISRGLKKPTSADEPPPTISTAKVATVRAHEGGMTIHADGVAVPYREIDIAAEVSGRVIHRAEVCRAGKYVRKGQLLVSIDPKDYQLEVDRLDREVHQATVALLELDQQIVGANNLLGLAEKELELRGREFARLKKLGRTAVSTSDLEKTQMAELTTQNTMVTLNNRIALLNVGKARLDSALALSKLKLTQARNDLQRTQIMAPADGVIINGFVEQDSYVQRGTPLVTLEDTAKVEVKCKLPMEDLYWLWDQPGGLDPVPEKSLSETTSSDRAATAYDIPDVTVDVVYRMAGHNDQEYTWKGRLERFDGLGLDETTRTVPCRVVVDKPLQPIGNNGPPALLRGMYVTIRIHVSPQTPLLQVPEKGLRPGNKVWCVRDGKLSIIPVNFVNLLESAVTDGNEQRHALVYTNGADANGNPPLSAGDQVIVSPLVYVRTGMDVDVTSSTPAE